MTTSPDVQIPPGDDSPCAVELACEDEYLYDVSTWYCDVLRLFAFLNTPFHVKNYCMVLNPIPVTWSLPQLKILTSPWYHGVDRGPKSINRPVYLSPIYLLIGLVTQRHGGGAAEDSGP